MSCKVIKHRCNTISAALAALADGYSGVEFDLVWREGCVCVHHEHEGHDGILFRNYLSALPPETVLAINVKEYGFSRILREMLEDWDYFVFDVPGPELEEYRKLEVRVFGRVSEYEVQLAEGALIDSFNSDPAFVEEILEINIGTDPSIPIALISPTLRGHGEWLLDLVDKVDYLITKD